MADAGAILSRSDAPKSRYRAWGGGDVDRFRKAIVALTLAFGDVVAAIAAISLSRALIGMTDAQPPEPKHLLIAILILTFLCGRLYTGCGPSPYERFRLRTIGIVAFVAIELLVEVGDSPLGPLLLAGVSDAVHLLIFGHYVEAMIRTLLIHLDLWGASVALVGYGENSQKLAQLLAHQPSLGLRPLGFV